MSNEAILDFYSSTDGEKNRLDVGVFQLEKIRTRQIIQRYLEGDKQIIADIGGATGAYSFWLYDLGHHVHLLDVTPAHIEEAQRIGKEQNKPLASMRVGDGRNLPYDGEMFDMVLLFGPLYHLQERNDRVKCLREAYRVLKPGGIVLGAAITRYASLFDGFWNEYVMDPDFLKILKQDLESGQHQNFTDNKMYFTTAHFHTQQELEKETSEAGFTDNSVISIEGFGWLIPGFEKRWSDASYRELMLQHIALTERDPVMVGISAHIMAIGKK